VTAPTGTYLYLELALLIYAFGFGWELCNLGIVFSPRFLLLAIGLAMAWFGLDSIALQLGIWSFPPGGTLQFRILGVPLEECILFFIHTLACYLFIRLYRRIS
jgi:lycopene cyclase domain-containing protein